MTTATSSIPVEPAAPALAGRRVRLGSVVASHTAVDFFSFLIIPIMSVLEGRLELAPAQGSLVIGLGALSSGVIQPLVAWVSDRWNTRIPGVLGFLAAVIAIGSIGRVQTYPQLIAVQMIGTAGIGAFHPVAAASVGQLAGRRRSLGVACFFVAGMVGGVAGNAGAPLLHKLIDVSNFGWLILPGVVVVAAFGLAVMGIPHRAAHAQSDHAALGADERRLRWFAVGVLYAGNALRFIVNQALIQLVIRWSEQATLTSQGAAALDEGLRDKSALLNGPSQAAMQIGMATGGLVLGALLRPRHEKRAMVVLPLLGVAAITAFPLSLGLSERFGSHAATVASGLVLAALSGIGFGALVPVSISMAQRLLPHRTSLASGLMMGGAWALAAIGAPLGQLLINAYGLEPAFWRVAGLLLATSLIALLLPGRLIRELSAH